MKTIYIKDACCGIKIECPDEYSCMLINEYHDQESILRLTKSLVHNKDALMIDICFNSLGELADSRNCRINSSEYSYIMKNHKTNITSYHCYLTNSQGDNSGYDYQDDVYLTDQLEPIRTMLNNLISKKTSKEAYNKRIFSEIKDIIINDPATIILWKDGTKTVVKCQNEDTFDPGTGIAMAILKKLYGNSGFYKDIFEPAIEKYELKKSLEKSKKHVATKKEKKYTVK